METWLFSLFPPTLPYDVPNLQKNFAQLQDLVFLLILLGEGSENVLVM